LARRKSVPTDRALLATVQAFDNLAASAIAGLLYTIASPTVAVAYLAG